MNKKFSTLIASLLLSGVFSVATNAQTAKHGGDGLDAKSEIPYHTIATQSDAFDVNFNDRGVNVIDGSKWYQLEVGTDQVLVQVRDYDTGELTLKVVNQNLLLLGTESNTLGNPSLNSSLWKIRVVERHAGAFMYEFTNKATGYQLSYNCDDAFNLATASELPVGSLIAEAATVNKSSVSAWRWYTADVSANSPFGAIKIYTFNHTREKVLGLAYNASGEVVLVDIPAAEVVNGVDPVGGFNILSFTVRNAGARVLSAADVNSMIDADGSWQNRPSDNTSEFAEVLNGFTGNDLFNGKYRAINTLVSELQNETVIGGTYAGYSLLLRKQGEVAKYLMVATDSTYESNKLPTEHGGLVIEDALYDGDLEGATTIDALRARYHWKLTYYPTPDSLVFEPLNASFIGTRDKQEGKKWSETPLAGATIANFYNTVNAGVAHPGGVAAAASNVPFEKDAFQPVALTLMNSSEGIDNNMVLTIGQAANAVNPSHFTSKYGKPVLTDGVADMGIKVQFAHNYTYLERTSLADDVYFIKLSVASANKTDYRKEGMNLVYNMEGRLMYDMQDDYQDYESMPATQWVIERDTCALKVEGGITPNPYVSIYNREYGDANNKLFYGQLYAVEGSTPTKYYIINHADYDVQSDTNGKFAEHLLSCGDTLYFIPVADGVKADQYLGYKRFDPEALKYETYAIRYLTAPTFGAPNTDNFLNIERSSTDDLDYLSINPNRGLDFEIDTLIVDEPFGFASEKAGAVQLKRTTYALKVRDANLIDNQWNYVVVADDENGNPYYQMRHLQEVEGKNVKLGTFYFKADQITVDNDDAYALVDATGWSATADPKKEKWIYNVASKDSMLLQANPNETAPYVGRLYKDNGFKRVDVKDQSAKVSFMTLNTYPMDRVSAFIFDNAKRPLYKTIQEGTVEIYRERGAGFEFLFNDGHNATGLTEGEYDKSATYVGITAEGVQPAEDETTEMYVHKVLASNPRMPKYLFYVNEPDSVKDGRWCTTNTHGYFPSEAAADEEDASHHVFYNGYLAGEVMVNFNDSITDGHDMLMNARQYGFRNYVRLGFVEAIHMNITKAAAEAENAFGFDAGEYLFVFKGTTIADVTSRWDVVDPALLKKAIDEGKVNQIELTAAHQNVAFSLRLTELSADEDGKDVDEVLLESKGLKEEGSIGTFSDASWVQILNGVPVLAQKHNINGDHTEIDGTSSLSQLVNQAQLFRLDGEATIPTSNEEVEVNGITVYSAEGAVIVKGATGVATITNVLGQVVSKTTITSDYETIAAPAGVVFVTVNGETVKVLVK